MEKPFQVFCCYAREDQPYLLLLKKHLKPLERRGLITVQADIDVSPGEEWEKKISYYLNTAQMLLLLISPDFMNSEYCYSKEMMRAMERHECGETRVIPIMLRSILWYESPFAKLQMLPTNAAPVISHYWQMPDDAFLDVAKGIRKAAEELLSRSYTEVPTVQQTHVTLEETLDNSIATGDIAEPSRHQTTGEKSMRTLAGERSYQSPDGRAKNSQSPPLIQLVSPPSAQEKQEKRDRQSLLKKVKARVAEEIRASLYNEVLREFRLSTLPEAVAHPWHFLYQPLPHAAYELPANTSITEIYDRARGTLLLTGEGGAGKTTLLQMLALDLLQRAEQEETEPIPFVVNLATWTKKHQDFSQWLVEMLEKKPYRLSPLVSQLLIQKDRVLPLLDGVNQIAPSELAACVQAIDVYQQEHSLLPLVLCSRDTDALEHHGGHLLDAIITIQPLLPQQIDAYLQSIDGANTHIHEAFQRDPQLYELAKTPLMLCLLILMARQGAGFDPSIPVTMRRQQIFSLYTQYMINRADIPQRYSPQNIERWLRYLARYLTNNRESEFYVEHLTIESFLYHSSGFSAISKQVLFKVGANSLTLLPLIWGLSRLVDNTLRAYVPGYTRRILFFDIFLYLPSISLSSSLFLIMLFLSVTTLIFFCYPLYPIWPRSSRPMGTLHFWEVWPRLAKEHQLFLIFGAFGLVPVLWATTGPFPAFASALISFVTMLLTHPIPKKLIPNSLTRSNRGVWYSFLQGISYGLASGLLFGSVTGIAVWSQTTLSWGLTLGFFTAWVVFWLIGLAYGGNLVIRHYYLRLLVISKVLPLNLSRFLHHAESRLLLRRINGGYSFYHPFFLEYFAASSTTMQPPSAGTPASERAGTRRRAPASRRRRTRKITHLRKLF
jgi:hypothetical protein